jgi:hypothetical protein
MPTHPVEKEIYLLQCRERIILYYGRPPKSRQKNAWSRRVTADARAAQTQTPYSLFLTHLRHSPSRLQPDAWAEHLTEYPGDLPRLLVSRDTQTWRVNGPRGPRTTYSLRQPLLYHLFPRDHQRTDSNRPFLSIG